MKEEQYQMRVIIPYLNTIKGLVYHHSPNGGKRSKREAAKFKAMGTTKGFPDLVLFYEGRTLLIELKRPRVRDPETGRLSPKGFLSESQKSWRDYAISTGVPWCLVEDLDELKKFFQDEGIIK